MARMTNVPIGTVDGFPVTNDGTLHYNEVDCSYSLDLNHMFQVAKSLMICAQGVDFGRIKDDRTKKGGRSLSKDEEFVRQNEGFCDMYDEKSIAKLFASVAQHGVFLKCDVNFNAHRRNKEDVDVCSKQTRLIFVFGLSGKKNATQRDLYVKFDFTKTRGGIVAHLDSLHYHFGGL